MKQYHQLLREIKEKGTYKPAAREGMPGTISLFGYQMRFNLQEGFPLVTTKKVSFKNIVVELLWFLKGDTNIKYLVDNKCNVWNEDAYNYYLKKCKEHNINEKDILSFEHFIGAIKLNSLEELKEGNILTKYNYTLGDCGKQYGWLWRKWSNKDEIVPTISGPTKLEVQGIDQLKELIDGLKNNPMSRRHIITAWNPATLDDMALNACHAFVQFNCRPIPWEEKLEMAKRHPNVDMENLAITEAAAGNPNFGPIPQYYLDCQIYQRSCDTVLGLPYNIASYALLTEILCKICNMVPGEYIHTFGDVHIYENHLPAVEEQLQRDCRELPKLVFSEWFNNSINENQQAIVLNEWIESLKHEDFKLDNYNPHPKLENETKLFTGLK